MKRPPQDYNPRRSRYKWCVLFYQPQQIWIQKCLKLPKSDKPEHGTDLTIITYGLGVHWALEAAAHRPQHTFEILDLRTLLPLDLEAIIAAASKTGRVLVLHEDTITAGIGGEIVALVNEHCFEQLDAPVLRVASLDTPVPFAADLEQQFLAQNRLLPTIDKLLAY